MVNYAPMGGVLKTHEVDANGNAFPAGAVGGRHVQVVPTANTDAHTSGDVIAATEVLTGICPAANIPALLRTVTVARLDSTTGIDIRIWFFKANVALGTESAAVSITDADADDILGYVDFVAADFVSLVNFCFAQVTPSREVFLIPVVDTANVYFAIEARGSVDLAAATDLIVNFFAL